MVKNETLVLNIDGYASNGDGVAHHDGRAIFVRRALRGETIEARLLKVTKTAVFAKIERIITSSPERIEPDCPHYGKCGGCGLRHMSYTEELTYKRERVADALRRIGGVEVEVPACVPSPQIDGYRNKAIFEVEIKDGSAIVGFYREHSHDIVEISECRMQSDAANAAAMALRQWAAEYRVADDSVHGLFVREGDAGVQVAVITSHETIKKCEQLIKTLEKNIKKPLNFSVITQRPKSNVALKGELKTILGEEQISDTLGGLRFNLSPRSFYQINRPQAEQIYDEAVKLAALSDGDVALDLYCGAGTITLSLAKSAPKSARIIGAEIVPDAVENARENAELNGISNVEFILSDVSEAAKTLAAQGVSPTVVLVDPPRKGLAADVVTSISAMAPQRIVYVSCDPATLARDIALFAKEGYVLNSARAYDMFPRCAHVECVALIARD